MTSITASACVKSSLPFKKALFVNSPGSAKSAPQRKTSESVFDNGTIPP